MIALPPLPYAENALEPHLSTETLATHHGKHHKAYVDKTNALVAGTPLEGKSLDEIVAAARRDGNQQLFNQSAQVWNHNFLWPSLRPDGGGTPSGDLAAMIDRDLGGIDGFRTQWTKAATGHFGSGWCWLAIGGGTLSVTACHDADAPFGDGKTPLLTLDLWEHAYYLDWKNERPKYVAAFVDHLLNWDFAAANLAVVNQQAQAA